MSEAARAAGGCCRLTWVRLWHTQGASLCRAHQGPKNSARTGPWLPQARDPSPPGLSLAEAGPLRGGGPSFNRWYGPRTRRDVVLT